MENSPIPENAVLEKAYNSIDNLSILLRFVDACFKHVPVEKLGILHYELRYDYGSEHDHTGVDGLCKELKSSVNCQYENSKEIDGSVYLNFYQPVVVNSVENELRYTGILRIIDNACFIRFLWHSSSREIRIDISRHLPSEEVLNIYVHFQEAMSDQLNRFSNEQ